MKLVIMANNSSANREAGGALPAQAAGEAGDMARNMKKSSMQDSAVVVAEGVGK